MLTLTKIRFKNFLATGNHFTEIDLETDRSTIISGKNGTGKSTIIDAICYALFGKPFRKINLGQLINSVNGKGALVEIEFRTKGHEYMVRRGEKPKKLEVFRDGEELEAESKKKFDQKALEGIIGMGFKTFTQIIILGSASYSPFMQLSATDRRAVIEDLLDIQVFTRMNAILKERHKETKNEVSDSEIECDRIERELILVRDHNQKVKRIQEDQTDYIQSKIDDVRHEQDQIEDELASVETDIKAYADSISDADKIDRQISKLKDFRATFRSKISDARKKMKFYSDNDDCPTCKQPLSNKLKEDVETDTKETVGELESALVELERKLEIKTARMEEIETVEGKMARLEQKKSALQSSMKSSHNQIKKLEGELEDQGKEQGVADEEKAEKLQKDLDTAKEVLYQHKKVFQDQKAALSLLKDDGIKASVIKQYIPVMNTLINKYLAAMGLYIEFELDENFKETIRSRHLDDFVYESFSEGQKMRIDLAILFAWRDIAAKRNSAACNILIMDEVLDGSLDDEGSEEFLKIIKEMTEQTNIIIISHKGENFQDKFDRSLRVSLQKGFTEYETV